MTGKPRGGKRKMWKRRPRKGGKKVNINRALQPVAQRYICKLKYTQTFSLDNSSTTAYRYRLNSIWNPDILDTAVNPKQPYGFEQLKAIYNRYRVVSCSYSIMGYNTGGPVRLVALPANSSLFPGNPSQAMESPRAKWIIQVPGGNTKMLKGKVYIPSLVGRTKAQYMADDRYQAQTSASPSENAILNIYHAQLNDTALPSLATNVVITLHYTVEFFDIEQLPSS